MELAAACSSNDLNIETESSRKTQVCVYGLALHVRMCAYALARNYEHNCTHVWVNKCKVSDVEYILCVREPIHMRHWRWRYGQKKHMESTPASTQHGPFDSTFGSYSLFETQAHVHASYASSGKSNLCSVILQMFQRYVYCFMKGWGLKYKSWNLSYFCPNPGTDFP